MVQDGIVERIRKVLAMTSSPNEHEAATAAAMVSDLLGRYNLSIEEVEASGEAWSSDIMDDEVSTGTKRNQGTWKGHLSTATARYHFCKPVVLIGLDITAFIGTEINVLVAKEVYNWLVEQVEAEYPRTWKRYQETTPKSLQEPRPRFRRGFYLGAVKSIIQQLYEKWDALQKESPEATTALVVRNDAALQTYMDNKWDTHKIGSRTRSSSRHGFSLGRAAGGRMDVQGKGKRLGPGE